MIVNVADLVNPETGKTWCQENAELEHNIPLGTLVEVVGEEGFDEHIGVRLFVIYQGRDCDMEPLYWLSPYSQKQCPDNEFLEKMKWLGGFCEDSLKVIKKPD